MKRSYDLPIDLPQKSEMVQTRIGTIIVFVVMLLMVFLLFLLSVNVGLVLAKGASALPDIRLLKNWQPNQSTQIFDRHGVLLANIHGDEDRVVVPLEDISPQLVRAVLATEDNRFYHHNGVDLRGTFRAAYANFKGTDVQGGSTVTQQLVKNLFLTPERSIGRKLAEALLALQVERYYSKEQILEMYLNQVYWGNQAYGIEKAARRYFRKPASDLSIAEASLLAGLLKAPEGLSPYGHPKAARQRQLVVLDAMVRYGYITEEQRRKAARTQWNLNTQAVKNAKHPYFITFVIQELVKQFGEDAVRRGGLRVFTSLDQEVQDVAEKALFDGVKKAPKFSNVTNGAMVVIDNKTAEIIALVGGVNFEKSQFNSATQARRAAGSTFKPIVYLTGLRLGVITPDTMTTDSPIAFNTGYSVWSPKNWDGKYMGAMTIRRALTLSRNTPTVRIGMKVGIDEVIKTAKLAGITSPLDANFSSLLGSSGISPLEMATVYSTFARGGIRMYPTPIRRLENVKGRPIPLKKPKPEQVFEPNDVANLVSILVDVVEKGTGRGAMLEKRQVAGKTGTTDKVRDIWFAGMTTDMTCVVWMGNDKYIPLRGVFSSNAAKAFHDFAQGYYELRPIKPMEFPKPNKDLKVVKGVRASHQTISTGEEPEVPQVNETSGDLAHGEDGPKLRGGGTSGTASTGTPDFSAGGSGQAPPVPMPPSPPTPPPSGQPFSPSGEPQ